MAISWDSFDKIWASTSPLTPYNFSNSNYQEGWNFVGATPPNRQMWDFIQKQNDEKFKYLRDNFGTPNMVTSSSQMTDTEKVYVYMGSEAGWNSGHWYYYDEGTSSWADGGVYNSVAFVTDTTLSIAGQPADAKATGDALALKSDLAGCTFTGNVNVNADFSTTGDASVGGDFSVAGASTLTGDITAGGDINATGDVSADNLTTSADATIGGNLSVTGTTALTGNITAGDVTANDVSVVNINASNNGTIGGNLSVTGTSTLAGNVTANGDVTAGGDVSADNISATTNGTIGGALSVAGASTLTGNVSAGADIVAVGDVSSANITASNNATIGGNATVTGSVSSATLTTSADGTIGGNLSVAGTTTLTGDVTASADLIVAGDSSLTNLSVSGTTALAGTSTAPTPSADDNSTKIATTAYVQTEIKPIETDATINDKRISNIEKLLQGNLYDYQTDSDSKYTKTVPQGAMPYASLEQIGGKTLVWNQLNDNSGATGNAGGIDFTNNGDGSWTINGTATSSSTKIFGYNDFVNGHKYYIKGCPAGGSTSTYSFGVAGGKEDIGSGGMLTATATGHYNLRFNFASGTTFNNVKIYPQLTDLTLCYGSGNEPTTVAEFQQTFPAQWYAFNNGTLLSAGVTEVVSAGRNLWNLENRTRGDAGESSNTTPRSWNVSEYYYSFTRNNYYYKNVGTFASVTDGFEFTPAYNYTGILLPFKANAGETYTLTCNYSGAGFEVGYAYYDNNGNLLSFNSPSNALSAPKFKSSCTTPANTYWVAVVMIGSANTQFTVTNIQFEKSATATEYVPYRQPISYPIPAEVQALEGYGWSAGSVYNYVDFERKVFVQRVAKLSLAVADMNNNEDFPGWRSSGARAIVGSGYNSIVVNSLNQMRVGSAIGINTNDSNDVLYLPKASYNNLTQSQWMSTYPNLVLDIYFEIPTPIETDISAYLTDDNLIEVESGGSLTFPNQHGDDYRIDVPSSETYMVDLQEAI